MYAALGHECRLHEKQAHLKHQHPHPPTHTYKQRAVTILHTKANQHSQRSHSNNAYAHSWEPWHFWPSLCSAFGAKDTFGMRFAPEGSADIILVCRHVQFV